ncbi:tetratricopeptide repeat protein [Mucilaginibacter calamicampi]|uniref:histidine kinase n=1 Tax=Mucilaginibacter calamicampi TaxID=1302352 RepID=A0ABW2Z1I6_9SPHI
MTPSLQNSRTQVVSLLDEGYACRSSNLTLSVELAQKALSISREINDKPLVAKSLSQYALFLMIQGEYDSAINMSKEALAYFEELKDELGVASAKYNLGGVYYKTNDYYLGMAYLTDCVNIYRKNNDHQNLARALKSLGTIYDYFGDPKNAIRTYEQAIAESKLAGDLNQEANAYNPLASIYLKQKDIQKAIALIDQSVAIKQKTGDIRGLAFALYGRGKIAIALKKHDEAEADIKEAIRIHKEVREVLGLGMALHRLAVLYAEMRQFEKAKQILDDGLKLGIEYHLIMVNFKCYYLYYQIFKQQGDTENALRYLELYFKEKDTVINNQTLKLIENYEMVAEMDRLKKEAQMQLEKAEIIEKKNHAEQMALVKQEFLSTMSHEIRTPLNAVITIASLLSDRADKEEQELLSSLRLASNNLLLLINDILDFTKLEAGKTALELAPCNFLQLLENIRNTYVSLASEKGVLLQLNIADGVASAYELDETKLSQILGNLITNAIKFTYTGSVQIFVEKIDTLNDGDLLRLKIIDTGIGISPKNQQSIFDAFTQPHSITKKKHGGSGLGLAIVKKLVSLHNSNVKVESTEGEGSTFYFDLILKPSAIPGGKSTTYSDDLNGKKVLLAEDNLINAMVITRLLGNWKINTEHAKNGLEALVKTRNNRFDFILMDIHMPEMDGFEAAREISTGENVNNNTPIFALTADITAEHQSEHRNYFAGFLRKPIEPEKLFTALAALEKNG